MSVNVKNLLSVRVPQWIEKHLATGCLTDIASPFWVIPIEESDPNYKELCSTSLSSFGKSSVVKWHSHESLIFILLNDDGNLKLCISNLDSSILMGPLPLVFKYFSSSVINFLQMVDLIAKFELPAKVKIPINLVKELPIFEDDLVGYFPDVHVLSVNDAEEEGNIFLLVLKSLLVLESDREYVKSFGDLILSVGYSIPIEGHNWIYDQLYSAIRSQRLVNFYLELYKLFEFFFPLDNIFKLAEKLGYTNSELELLQHCRGSLSWNVNHQRGARSAMSYASIGFAEACLGESFSGEKGQEVSFKERAIEKMTTARHALTHQDFRSASVKESDLSCLAKGLLLFLQDAFTLYGSKLKTRREPPSSLHRNHKTKK